MKILFRVDSSLKIGRGHLMRCLSFADYLHLAGHQVSFAMQDNYDNSASLVLDKGYELLLIPTDKKKVAKNLPPSCEYLGVSQSEDFNSLIGLIGKRKYDALIIDHYGISQDWEIKAKNHFDILFVIDDLGRTHSCDFLLDMTLYCEKNKYASSQIRKKTFLGSQYAVLRKDFLNLRESSFKKRMATKTPQKLIFSMGGGSGNSTIYKALLTLSHMDSIGELLVEVICNPSTHSYSLIKNLCSKKSFNLFNFQNDMPNSLFQADIAIGAGGTSSYERASLGLPSLMIQTADNQTENLQAFSRAGAALVIEDPNSLTFEKKLSACFQQICQENTYKEMLKKAFSVSNPIGFIKVLEEVFHCSFLRLRKAHTGDCTRVYDWQSFPGARTYSRNPEVPNFLQHQQWFTKALNDPHKDLWILEALDVPLGFLRLDRQEKKEVSILISYAFWGAGLGKKSLNLLRENYPKEKLHAYISPENIASQKIFTSCGYEYEKNNWYVNQP